MSRKSTSESLSSPVGECAEDSKPLVSLFPRVLLSVNDDKIAFDSQTFSTRVASRGKLKPT